MTDDFTHFAADGSSRMVDVSDKPIRRRQASASGRVRMAAETLAAILDKTTRKGDVLEVARLAGILGAKKTADLIPLCHPLALTSVNVDFRKLSETELEVRADCRIEDRTGVEMEALTAVSIACLTIYDMCKAVDRGMEIASIRLEAKSGGSSGTFRRS